MRLIDSHAHLNFRGFRKNREEVIAQCIESDIRVVNPSSQLTTSEAAVELAKKYPDWMYAAVGFHPVHIGEQEYRLGDFDRLIANNPLLVRAIGEIGLDYYRLPENASKAREIVADQKIAFRELLGLCLQYDKAAIIHCREAYDDLADETADHFEKGRGVIHCYLGNRAQARRFLDQGFLLGFTGIITFTDDEELIQVIRETPLDRVLVETDSPYLAPEPVRRTKNTPLNLHYVVAKIAEVKQLPVEEVARATVENAEKLFSL
ncbi:MAG: TatD family hydrolase [bacterium]|nr:TatD family hydrolase [bacterium]